ncbi:S1 family peptidase [Streptomyces sp. TS71-3]|uniref:S1 family peptidase n=1 Tax=Streptomyces sp. TS71-3 TaxID=2733862 RepID=UPI001B1C6514|nr:S1 family peptidase [Streptomyces sp. TS71-3]GHJ38615.1 serine protease [Streptomyces sp. TS71-3]
MNHRRIPGRRTAITGASVAALVIAGISFQTANASTETPTATPDILTVAKAGKLASSLTSDLGKDAAGTYYDATAKHLVVNVLNDSAARAVETAGAKAKVVKYSLGQLKSAGDTLKAHSTAGTSWVVDPTTNRLVVTADRTVTGAKLDKLTKTLKGLGGTTVLKHTKGQFKPFIAGGDAISDPSIGRCSLGFNVVKDGQPYFITAGHCTEEITNWSDSDGNVIGENADSDFPGNDFGLVKYTADVDHPSEVDLYNGSSQPITKAGDATVGEKVQRSGSTTQVHDGTVKGLNATVDYGNGDVVEGLIDTDVCAEPGDSGGSLFDGETALGLTSGGSGDCTSGGETFFQPVPEALSAFGAEIG